MAVWGLGTVMGPIIGPLLGGWLTQDYSWRWVFYINVPFGIAAAVGLIAALPETRQRHSPFDLFGFATLSLGIGALQLMLDRGPLKDWFSSTEIGIEALLAAVGLYLFTIHTLSARQPFIGRALFTNRNFIIGNAFVFIFGAAVFAVIAVLPTLLQGPMGYPALTAGLVTAPRSVGTAVSMLVVGRLIGRIDARWLVTAGFLLNALALGQMAAFSPQMDAMPVIVSGMVQGFGAGLSYVAMTTVAFATLPEALRNEGAALFSLSRNIGSSIGISSIQAYITYGTSRAHARLTEYITPFSVVAADPQMRSQLHSTAGLLSLDAQVGMQASWISYIDAFWVLMLAALLIVPLIFFVRGARGTADQPQVPLE
jgi:DHA2 family multidrug resistance protein